MDWKQRAWKQLARERKRLRALESLGAPPGGALDPSLQAQADRCRRLMADAAALLSADGS